MIYKDLNSRTNDVTEQLNKVNDQIYKDLNERVAEITELLNKAQEKATNDN